MKAKPVSREVEQAIRERLEYNPDTGELVWKVSPAIRVKVGDLAGSRQRDGYRIVKVSGRALLEHRIAWFLTYGEWPPEEIDHINGVKDDNRLVNLRLSTHSENSLNLPRHREGRLPYAYPSGNRWRAQVRDGHKQVHIGMYPTEIQAHRAAKAFLGGAMAIA